MTRISWLVNLDYVEAIWIILTGVGLYFANRLFWEAHADLKALKIRGVSDPETRRIARSNRRFGFILTFYMTWYFLLGILAAFQPPPPTARTRTGLGLFTLWVFLGMQALFSTGLWLNLRDRPKPSD